MTTAKEGVGGRDGWDVNFKPTIVILLRWRLRLKD